MGIINIAMSEHVDAQIVPQAEYELRVLKTLVKPTINDPEIGCIHVTFEVLGQEGIIKDIMDYIVLPHSKLDDKQNNYRTGRVKRLHLALGFDVMDEVDTEHWVGHSLFAFVKIDGSGDEDRNVIHRYLMPSDGE